MTLVPDIDFISKVIAVNVGDISMHIDHPIAIMVSWLVNQLLSNIHVLYLIIRIDFIITN